MDALPGLRGPIPSFHLFTARKEPLDMRAGYYDTQSFLDYLTDLSLED